MKQVAYEATLLDAILELQQLRRVARHFRNIDELPLMKAAYQSARLLCREIRDGKIRAIGNYPYRALQED